MNLLKFYQGRIQSISKLSYSKGLLYKMECCFNFFSINQKLTPRLLRFNLTFYENLIDYYKYLTYNNYFYKEKNKLDLFSLGFTDTKQIKLWLDFPEIGSSFIILKQRYIRTKIFDTFKYFRDNVLILVNNKEYKKIYFNNYSLFLISKMCYGAYKLQRSSFKKIEHIILFSAFNLISDGYIKNKLNYELNYFFKNLIPIIINKKVQDYLILKNILISRPFTNYLPIKKKRIRRLKSENNNQNFLITGFSYNKNIIF